MADQQGPQFVPEEPVQGPQFVETPAPEPEPEETVETEQGPQFQ